MIAAGMAVALALLPPPQDPEVKAALKRFHEDFFRARSSDVDRKNAAVAALAAHPHEAVVDVLRPLLTRERKVRVRVKIAQELSRFGGVDGAGPALIAGLRSGANQAASAEAVRIVLLRGLGELKCVDAVPDVNRLIEDRQFWVAKAAIVAAGRLGQRSSVKPLVRALSRIEGPAGNGLLGLNPLDELDELIPFEPEARAANVREALREPLLQSLKSLTGQAYTRAEQYEAWIKGRKVPASDE